MARQSNFKEHRIWEDWVAMLLGVVVLLTPWLAVQTDLMAAVVAASVIGIALIVVSGLELARLSRWQEYATFLLGLALIAAPTMFAYSTSEPITGWHHTLGALVTILSLFEIWQDWRLTDDQLAQHGR